MTTSVETAAPPGSVPAMTGRQRLLAAARREPVDTTPVWFMRQAGRSLPEYRALRERYDFLTVAKTPELAAAATLMPVSRLGVDGAVLFADIMLPVEGMGVPFAIEPNKGPVIAAPIRSAADVDLLRVLDAEEATPYVLDAVRLLRSELGERAALLGFSGAPFTLACYLVEGHASREYPRTKALMYGEPAVWHRLMETLTEVVVRYLRGQIAAGAVGGATKDVAGALGDDGKGGEEEGRVEVALDADVVADARPGVVERDAPVDADQVGPGARDQVEEGGGAGAEVDRRRQTAQLGHDPSGVGQDGLGVRSGAEQS